MHRDLPGELRLAVKMTGASSLAWWLGTRRELVDDLAAVAADLAGESGSVERRLDDLREHSREAMRDVFDLDRARRAMRLNPLRRGGAGELAELERRIGLAARLYRHARGIARDVMDAQISAPELAAALRDLIEASDLALRGEPAEAVLARAEERLTVDADGEALIIRAQLRQLLDDLRELGLRPPATLEAGRPHRARR